MKKIAILIFLKQKLKNFLHSHQCLWKCYKFFRKIQFFLFINPVVRFQQYCVHKKLSRVFQKHTRKIRIGFLVTENEKWCCQSLFDKLKNHPRFEPVIVLSSLTMDRPLEQLREKFYRNQKFFRTNCGNVVEAYDPQTNTFLSLKSFGLDIIFYQQPWNISKKQNILATCKFALACYVPYSFEDDVKMVKKNLNTFHKLLFREYISHPLIEQAHLRVGILGISRKTVGYPKLEFYLNPKKVYRKKYVIYAPHHSVESNSLRLGTFAWNGHFMLEYAKKHAEFNWIFKPHPRCKVSFVAEGLFKSRQELEDYYSQWATIGEVCEQGNYMDLFQQTKCLITDCGSFLVEFFPSEQPVIHLKCIDSNYEASISGIVSDVYYSVFDLETLKHTLHLVLEKGEDPMRQARLDKLQKLQLVQPASNNIIRDLEESLSRG